MHAEPPGRAAAPAASPSSGTAPSTTPARLLADGPGRRRRAKSASSSTRQSTNEDLYALARLAFDHLGVGKAYLAGLDQGWSDDILVSRRQEPEHRRRQAIGAGRLRTLLDLANDLKAGALTALLVVGTRRRAREERRARALPLDRLQTLVVVATHRDAVTDAAQVALPLAAWAEVDGTFTNKLGMVQRIRAAVPPAGDALPGWEILSHLARKLGATMDFTEPKAVFAEAKQKLPFMKGADWGRPKLPVQLRFAELARLDAECLTDTLGFTVVAALIKILFMILGFLMPLASILTWLERRQSSMMQDRLGPNRANIPLPWKWAEAANWRMWGITHFMADAVKFLFKEDYVPSKAHKFLFMWAPDHGDGPAAHRRGDHPLRSVALLGRAVRQGGRVCSQPGAAADRPPRRRPAVLLRHLLAGRLRRHPGRLGLPQQVGDDGRPARQLADDVLRGHDGHGRARRVPGDGHARAGRDRRPADGLLQLRASSASRSGSCCS